MESDQSSIDVLRNVLIPMRDGVRLAGNLHKPAGDGPFPCIVNHIPYHKDGRTGRGYADQVHRHFARRGYAAMIIDFRGLGCSEGINNVPFDAQEGRDGHDAVEWIARQPWCDGNVGMWGTSYGGITSLKTAAERPPHLKAICPVHATADNYLGFLKLGDCWGGFWANGDWGPRMIGHNLTPPLADDPDGRLAKLWAKRLDEFKPWPLEWYEHADDAARWAERAIRVERITVPTYAVCGWQDFYIQDTFDYFNRLKAPKKLLIGPWKHLFPNLVSEEPVNFLEIMTRWWDRWLRGEKNGIEAGPPITIFVQGAGVWRHEEEWPPRRNESRPLYLAAGRALVEHQPAELSGATTYAYDPTVGLDSIGFDPWTTAVKEHGIHNGDDVRSLCFTTPPLSDDWDLTGEARVDLPVRASAAGLNFVAKLCDVDADGYSRLVTIGWCRDTAQNASEAHLVVIPLRATSHLFRNGHRLRVGIALADFPRLWPTPATAEIEVEPSGDCPARFVAPATPPQRPALAQPVFPPLGPALQSSLELESTQSWTVSRDLAEKRASLESRTLARYELEQGGTISYGHNYSAVVASNNPAEAAIDSSSKIRIERPGESLTITATSAFKPHTVTIEAIIRENDKVVWRKQWDCQRGGPVVPVVPDR